ncbi:MAG: glycosyltransferase family 2 protein [Candidatus Odinarchaeum yellowstonii]|uniref:Glycosyltransferase family 2 protein n=1 Tax=Odinarchaeota yellowstonii (strain LCB_4) TaxID=1841599 RepID=A0AAF0ICF4_ODILC|nr:MAG: glycosyltransferase family 2 protein [Candidatus Odinarchaeum yellowstonii]
MEITVIVPVYNEEHNITNIANLLVKRLTELNYSPEEWEILFVDDGSTDNTPNRLRELSLKNPSVKYIRNPHKGKGNAIKTGLIHAKGEIIGIIDGDLEVRLAEPQKLYEYIQKLKNGTDIIIGSKAHPKTRGKISTYRRFLSIAFNKLARLLTGVKLKDTQSGLKILKKQVVNKILPLLETEGFTIDIELLSIAHILKYKIEEIPIKINLNNHFKTSEIIKMLMELLKITYKLKITREYLKQINYNLKSY